MSTIALCIICKNERINLPRLLGSVDGCFDEIHITDTGSTDGTVEWLKSQSQVSLHHFKWIDDFAAARNASFSHAKSDYVMWLDCDDVLDDRNAFIEWKKTLLPTAEWWLATYHYGVNAEKKPTCSFLRERVFARELNPQWQYFIHEGIVAPHAVKAAYVTSWSVLHLRSEADMAADRNRNLFIFEARRDSLDTRMQYYYGKELFEAKKPLEAFNILLEASRSKGTPLEMHDRILCLQYACMSAIQCNQFEVAINIAYQGLQLAPHRAEFYVHIGDCFVKLNQLDNAIPSYVAATQCFNATPNSGVFQGAIFTDSNAYQHYPRNMLAKLFFQKAQFNEAKRWLEEALLLGPSVETGALYAELIKHQEKIEVKPRGSVPVVDEYVISCPQQGLYHWDELIARERGIGGSETAVVHMARELHNLTGKVVRIFNDRPQVLEVDGVVYGTHEQARDYFASHAPKAHIAWRHCVPLTSSPTFLWCHDLAVPGIEAQRGYDKILALSKFHKNYLKHIFRLPEDKIMVTRNGIDLSRFHAKDFSNKNPNKIVFSSSPDRGLDRAIHVVSAARKLGSHDLELHCFYGFDNMLKMNLHAEVNRLKALVEAHPWVTFHGNVQQDVLVEHLKDAKAWIYPTDFLETFCITALEAIACRVRPVVRKWGALPDTLEGLPASVLDFDCKSQADFDNWGLFLIHSLETEQPVVDMERFSWKSVATDWLEWLPR